MTASVEAQRNKCGASPYDGNERRCGVSTQDAYCEQSRNHMLYSCEERAGRISPTVYSHLSVLCMVDVCSETKYQMSLARMRCNGDIDCVLGELCKGFVKELLIAAKEGALRVGLFVSAWWRRPIYPQREGREKPYFEGSCFEGLSQVLSGICDRELVKLLMKKIQSICSTSSLACIMYSLKGSSKTFSVCRKSLALQTGTTRCVVISLMI